MAETAQLIIFSGLKHSGKSSLARLTALRFGWAAQDLDSLIAQLATEEKPELGSPVEYATVVRALYRNFGREVFQDYETRAARLACQNDRPTPGILSLGGGTMENPAAMSWLDQVGVIIFLDTPFEILFERIMRGGLPAFLDPADPRKSFEILYEKRRALGRSQAHHILDLGSKSLDQAFQVLIPLIKEHCHVR